MNSFQKSIEDLLQQGLDHNIITHQELVYAACQVARAVLHLVPENESRTRVAIETAESWCFGKASDDEVKAAVAAVIAVITRVGSTSNARDAVYYAACSTNIVDAAYYAAATVVSVSVASIASTIFTIVESQQHFLKILLSHLPRLDKLKVWL